MTAHHFYELRLCLVECQTSLRAAKDTFEIVRAQREQAAIDTGQAVGSNAEQRARSLTIALATDPIYLQALSAYRVCEAECERVEALLEAARDERRHAEWQIRAKLADALLGADIPSDSNDPYGDDSFDSVLDSTIDDGMSHGNLNSTSYAGKRRPQPTYSMLATDPYDHAMRAGH